MCLRGQVKGNAKHAGAPLTIIQPLSCLEDKAEPRSKVTLAV